MPYVVTAAFSHLGRTYKAGDAIEPKPTLVGQLVASGCIKEVPPPLPVEPLASAALSVAATPREPLAAPEMPRDVRTAAERGPHKKPSSY